MEKFGEIFISHTHADAEIAHALNNAIEDVFEERLAVEYSTKKEDGGIKPGEEWFRWIGRGRDATWRRPSGRRRRPR